MKLKMNRKDEEIIQVLAKHLGDCLEYIDQLENSIERLNVGEVYDDMPNTNLDFSEAVREFEIYKWHPK